MGSLISKRPGAQHLEKEEMGGGRVSTGALGPGGVSVRPRMTPWGILKLTSSSELPEWGFWTRLRYPEADQVVAMGCPRKEGVTLAKAIFFS